jgi:hypothetical protein
MQAIRLDSLPTTNTAFVGVTGGTASVPMAETAVAPRWIPVLESDTEKIKLPANPAAPSKEAQAQKDRERTSKFSEVLTPFLIGLGVLAVILLILKKVRAKKAVEAATAKRADWAESKGWTWGDAQDTGFATKNPEFTALARELPPTPGVIRQPTAYAYAVATGEQAGLPVVVFDYHYLEVEVPPPPPPGPPGSPPPRPEQPRTTDKYFTGLIVRPKGGFKSEVTVGPRAGEVGLGELPVNGWLSDDNPMLNIRYSITTNDPAFASRFFNRAVSEHMMRYPELLFELRPSGVLFTLENRKISLYERERLIAAGMGLLKILPKNVTGPRTGSTDIFEPGPPVRLDQSDTGGTGAAKAGAAGGADAAGASQPRS